MSPAAPGSLYPTSVLVGIAWLETYVPEFVGQNMVGPSLPERASTWPNSKFVTVTDDRGGSDLVDVPLRRPLLRVSCWAATVGSNEPPRKAAAQAAECVRVATYAATAYGRTVTLGNAYKGARVQAAFIPTGTSLRSILNDPSGYARVDIDLEVDWLTL